MRYDADEHNMQCTHVFNVYITFTLDFSHYYRHFRLDLNRFTDRK